MALITNSSPYLEKVDYNNLTTEEKALVDALITAGSDWIERYCNRVFTATDYTDEIHNGTGENCIFVKNPPINSLTDIDIVGTSSTTTYLATKFKYEPKTGEIQFKLDADSDAHYFPEDFRNIQITYNGGFTTIPEAIKILVADFVVEYFDQKLKDELIEKEKIGDYFYAKGLNFYTKLSYPKKKLLTSYRLRRVR